MDKLHLIAQMWQRQFLSQGLIRWRWTYGIGNIFKVMNQICFTWLNISIAVCHMHICCLTGWYQWRWWTKSQGHINFVNRHFPAEMPHFDEEEFQNIYASDGALAYTEQRKWKAVEIVRMNNTHRCTTAINGCKKDANDLCKCGYSCRKMILETFVN